MKLALLAALAVAVQTIPQPSNSSRALFLEAAAQYTDLERKAVANCTSGCLIIVMGGAALAMRAVMTENDEMADGTTSKQRSAAECHSFFTQAIPVVVLAWTGLVYMPAAIGAISGKGSQGSQSSCAMLVILWVGLLVLLIFYGGWEEEEEEEQLKFPKLQQQRLTTERMPSTNQSLHYGSDASGAASETWYNQSAYQSSPGSGVNNSGYPGSGVNNFGYPGSRANNSGYPGSGVSNSGYLGSGVSGYPVSMAAPHVPPSSSSFRSERPQTVMGSWQPPPAYMSQAPPSKSSLGMSSPSASPLQSQRLISQSASPLVSERAPYRPHSSPHVPLTVPMVPQVRSLSEQRSGVPATSQALDIVLSPPSSFRNTGSTLGVGGPDPAARVRKTVLARIKDRLAANIQSQLQHSFRACDGGQGKVNVIQMGRAAAAFGLELEEAELQSMLQEVDADCDGSIDEEEYMLAMIQCLPTSELSLLLDDAFDHFDRDLEGRKDGKVDAVDLHCTMMQMLRPLTNSEAHAVIRAAAPAGKLAIEPADWYSFILGRPL